MPTKPLDVENGSHWCKYHPSVLSSAATLQVCDLVLYPDELKVERKGKNIRLSKKEYQLLEFLARNKNKVINRNTILEYVWNYSVHCMTNTLDVHMSNLRRKIDGGFKTKILQTVYGLGYKLCDTQ